MSRTKLYSVAKYGCQCPSTLKPFIYRKKGMFMKNSTIITSLASVGLFSNIFVFLAGKNLNPEFAAELTAISGIAFSAAFITFLFTQKSEVEIREERNDIYRDFDAVYRYVDDAVRDIQSDVRDVASKSSCCIKDCGKNSNKR